MNDKILLIGLDGGTFNIIKPEIEKGNLPNIERLMREGSYSELQSCFPPVTAPAWATFLTGKNPGKHGIFDFTKTNSIEGKTEVINATKIKGPTLIDYFNKFNKKIGLINIPLTFPPKKVNGFIISGIFSPSNANIFYPKELKEELEKKIGKYRITNKSFKNPGIEYYNDLIDVLDNKKKYSMELLKKYSDLDFFAILFRETDGIQHTFWKHIDKKHPKYNEKEAKKLGDKITSYYKKIDETIGEIIKKNNFDNIIIMSDHGFGPMYAQIHINNWFIKNGYIKFKSNGITNKLSLKLNTMGFTIEKIKNILEKTKLINFFNKLNPKLKKKLINQITSFKNIDWEKTTAFAAGNGGQVFINVKQEKKYIKIREKLIKELMQLKQANKENLFKKILKKEEIYSGELIKEAPDLYLIPKDEKHLVFSMIGGSNKLITNYFTNSGDHRFEAILIMSGKNIKQQITINKPKLEDIAPTILYLMNLPHAKEMDGRILKEIIKETTQEEKIIEEKEIINKEIKKEYKLNEKENKELIERLRNLGYIA